MKGNKTILVVLVSLMVFACGDTNETKAGADPGYRIYNLQKNGWKSRSVHHKIREINYKATAVPIEYYILKHFEGGNVHVIDSVSKLYERERIIEFEFEHSQNKDLLTDEFTLLDYDKSVTYLSSTIQNDFMVVTESKDTIPCSGVHFERHYKVSPFNRVLLYFGGIHPEDNIQLLYQDRLFQNGIFKFNFDEPPFKT